MAKMFYTLEEAAARLGLDEGQVKQLATDGKLQQFRDRNKLMFKRDQIDAMAEGGGSTMGTGAPIPIMGDTGEADTVDALGDTDTNPMDATDAMSTGTDMGTGTDVPGARSNPNDATGISVFDADEVEHADPMAQTQINQPSVDDAELALDSVGSGSGLLDLTRESDDTSLGVALDEIYPGGEGSDAKMDSAVGSSGVFESALGMETAAEQSVASGIDNLTGEAQPGFEPGAVMTSYQAEPYDPAGSGLGAGLLLGALVALILGLVVLTASIIGTQSSVTTLFSGGDQPSAGTMWAYLGGLVVISGVLGAVGLIAGKAAAR